MSRILSALFLGGVVAFTAVTFTPAADALCFRPRKGHVKPRINVPDANVPKINLPQAQIWNELRKSLGDVERQLILVRGVVDQLQRQYEKGNPAPSNVEPTRCPSGQVMSRERTGFMGMIVRNVCRPREPGPSKGCPPGQMMRKIWHRSYCMVAPPKRIYTKGPESLRRPVLAPKKAPAPEEKTAPTLQE